MEEEDHIRKAVLRCNYPSWALNKLQMKINHNFSNNQAHIPVIRHQSNSNNSKTNNCNIFLVVPFTKGLSKSFKKLCYKVGGQVNFRGNNTIHNLLVAPKYKDPIIQKSGVITSLSAPRWIAMNNTFGDWEGCLGTDLGAP